MTKSMHRS